MKKVLLAGLINIETTVAINDFPIVYQPIDYHFFGIESTISGVGYNVTKALQTLGNQVDVLSLIGDDIYRSMIEESFKKLGVCTDYIQATLPATAQSVILYDAKGKRRIQLDLKNIQEQTYLTEGLQHLIQEADIVVPCNINFARHLLKEAKRLGKLIASDIHVVSDLEDAYNKDFMANADILFMSNEAVLGQEEAFVKAVAQKYHNKIIVMGMGAQGALLCEGTKCTFVPAVSTRHLISTVGAGDALFSAFIHFYMHHKTPLEALQNAVVFASYKIGEKGGAQGFLTEAELLKLKATFA